MNKIVSVLILFLVITNGFSQSQKPRTTRFSFSKILNKKLNETSGLIFWNNTFWTHNDDTDTNLYALDSVGNIVKSINIPNVKNTDWEEIQQDENHLYIGDFGNNASGNRTDLHIIKIEKLSIVNNAPKVEIITFSYKNQMDFTKKPANKTNFDCEAFVVSGDSIYLFTKEWKSKQTTLYTMPKVTGNYQIIPKSKFNSKGLITGATFVESKNIVVLCGYTKNGKPFVTVFYDFKNNDFLSGKHFKIKLKPRFQQIEAITSQDGLRFFLTSEHLKFLTKNNLQKMHFLDLSAFITIK